MRRSRFREVVRAALVSTLAELCEPGWRWSIADYETTDPEALECVGWIENRQRWHRMTAYVRAEFYKYRRDEEHRLSADIRRQVLDAAAEYELSAI